MNRALVAALLLALVGAACGGRADLTREAADWCMWNYSSVVEAGRDLGYTSRPEGEPRLICDCGGSCGFTHDEAFAASCRAAFENRESPLNQAAGKLAPGCCYRLPVQTARQAWVEAHP
jgi:hypothetical protein